jgi:hypothetical protein
VCETPGIWGKLPNGFVHFYESKAEVFITTGVTDVLKFQFNKGGVIEAINMTYVQYSRLVSRRGQEVGGVAHKGVGPLLAAQTGRKGRGGTIGRTHPDHRAQG